MTAPEGWLLAGSINGVFGVKGWVKVYSNTDPIENITHYGPWMLCQQGQWREVELKAGKRQGKTVIAKLADVDDADQAQLLIGAQIAVQQSKLPKLRRGEYYWTDLIGLAVQTAAGSPLGVVEKLLATGSNDVLVVRDENAAKDAEPRLIPWVLDVYIVNVDLEGGVITADWDPDY